jgi:hypothetical protein
MNNDYTDIRRRIPEEPKWFDEHAVPRYDDFHPSRVADIYAREAVLARITCQGCGRPFNVAFSANVLTFHPEPKSLASLIKAKDLHYGDPPNIQCCPADPTMNSEPQHVLEYWRRGTKEEEKWFEWIRDPAFELLIQPDWVAAKPLPDGDGEFDDC